MSKSPLVINFMGGPGCGKSSLTAGVFSKLKWRGVESELALEFAKDKVWEESLKVLDDQVYVLGKQHHRLYRLNDQVDVIVTDSPLLLSMIYGGHWGDAFAGLVVDLFHRYDNLTYVVERTKPYNPKGRMQTADEANQLDHVIRDMLDFHRIPFATIPGSPESERLVVKQVMDRLKSKKLSDTLAR